MAFPQMVLDTDTLSEIIKQRPAVIERDRSYLLEHKRFNLSVITRYEILRGLKSKGASTQAAAFDRLCELSNVLPVTDEVAKRGAEIYADLKGRGALMSDADILIAATALIAGLGVVTNNVGHFQPNQWALSGELASVTRVLRWTETLARYLLSPVG